MSKQMESLKSAFARFAEGDFSRDVDSSLRTARGDVGELARTLQNAQERQRERVNALQKLAGGDFSASVKSPISKDPFAESFGKLTGSLKALLYDFETAAQEAGEGSGAQEMEETRYPGSFMQIVAYSNEAVRKTMAPVDACSKALQDAAQGKYAKADGTVSAGPLGRLADSVNALTAHLEGLAAAAKGVTAGDFAPIASLREETGETADALTGALLAMGEGYAALNGEVGAAGVADGKAEGAGVCGKIVSAVGRLIADATTPLRKLAEFADAGFEGVENAPLTGDAEKVAAAAAALRARAAALKADAERFAQGGEPAEGSLLADPARQLEALTKGVRAAAEAAAGGNFTALLNPEGFSGRFAEAAGAVNGLLAAAQEPVEEIAGELGRLARLEQEPEEGAACEGVFAAMRDSIAAVRANLSALYEGLNTAMTQLAGGHLCYVPEKLLALEGRWKDTPVAVQNALGVINEDFARLYNTMGEVEQKFSLRDAQKGDLLEGSTAQASALEELSDTVANIADQTKKNAENAGQANTIAKDMKERAVSGNKEMEEMLASMHDIGESSRNISKIIKVIDGIAFQTNILALNAAVEAARAGQHGKGFAVVAEEVRNLAARSADAAKETTSLIEGSINRVNKGTAIAENTAKTLSAIVSDVDQVAEHMESIAQSSNNQATAVFEVTQGIDQVSKTVARNLELVQKNAEQDEGIIEKTRELHVLAAKFTVAEKKTLAAKPAVKPAAAKFAAGKTAPAKPAAAVRPAPAVKPVPAVTQAKPESPARQAAAGEASAEPEFVPPMPQDFGKY